MRHMKNTTNLCFALRFPHVLNCNKFTLSMVRTLAHVLCCCITIIGYWKRHCRLMFFFGFHRISMNVCACAHALIIALIVSIASFDFRVFFWLHSERISLTLIFIFFFRIRFRIADVSTKKKLVSILNAFHMYHQFYNKLSNRL